MTSGTWSETEPSVAIDSVEDLDRFVDFAESKAEMPSAISVDTHGYRVDLLVGHEMSFVHMTPDDLEQPYHVTIGGPSEGVVDFWLHSWHHTQFENRYLVPKSLAREAFREFFQTGRLSPAVEWEDYLA
jgi:Immunity protein Imm1